MTTPDHAHDHPSVPRDVPGVLQDVPDIVQDVQDVPEVLDGPARRARLRADVDLLTAAAAALRHAATQAAYQGRPHPDRAYAIASALDLAALRWPDQDPALRAALRTYSRLLLDDGHRDTEPPGPGPARPR